VRVALLHPTYWPEVRRGSERLVHDLASWLAGVGHDVAVLTTHRGRGETAHEDGFRVVRAWRPPDPLFQRRAYEDYLGAAASQVGALMRERVDVVQAFAPVSGWAALRTRRDGTPVVFSHMGIPTREYLVRSRYRLPMYVELAREASACTVLSEVAAESFRRYLLRDPEVIPPGVACADFEAETNRTDEPTIVYAGSAGDPRKRLPLLIDAFGVLRRRHPGTRLWLAGQREPLGFELPEGVEWVPGDRTEDLARALAAAHVAVLPSIREGFGLVLVEALAAGTPVVAAASGAAAEIVTPAVGRLFEPDDRDALVAALAEVLELEVSPEECRAHARQWDWSVVGPRYESLLTRAAEGPLTTA
jgi:glycosyltransferase involved in cell wall biosynthesis